MQPIWVPTKEAIEHSNIQAALQRRSLSNYDDLYRWSISQPADFWADIIETLGIKFETLPQQTLDLTNGPDQPCWLRGALLNIAESCFQADAEKVAIVFGEPSGDLQSITYGEVRQLAHQVASGLQQMGLQPGDAVAVFMPMTARSVPIYLGIVLAGCVVVSIADSFAKDELDMRLRIGNTKAIFVSASAERNGKPLGLFQRLTQINGPRAILVDDNLGTDIAIRSGDLPWLDFLGDANSFKVVYATPDSPINVLFSSGTTGDPKAVPWDHTTPIKAAADGHYHQDIHPADVVAWPTNLGWMMGPWLIFATMLNRGTIALYQGAPAGKEFGQFIEDAKVSMLGVIPSMVHNWQQTGCMEGLDWSAIRLFSSTGECSNWHDMKYLSQLAGGKPVIEYCGGTELGGGYVVSTMVQPNRASTFSTPTLGTEIILLDEQDQPADAGEVFLVPPTIGFSQRLLNRDHYASYYQDTPPGPEGKLLRRHGDQLERLECGYYRAMGRADDTMNLGGIKVGAAEIERAVANLPNVEELAAIAVSPPGGGPSQLVICIATVSSAAIDVAELKATMQQAIKTKLNPLFKIHDLLVLEKLPRTASNKIIHRHLRDQYLEQHQ